MARKKGKGTELKVFKGREAKLNRAIFQTLALNGLQTIYDIHKQVAKRKGFKYTRYASVNKRVRILKESGYINKAAVKETKAGFKASLYELTAKAYLILLLNSITLEDLLAQVNETTASAILGTLISATDTVSET